MSMSNLQYADGETVDFTRIETVTFEPITRTTFRDVATDKALWCYLIIVIIVAIIIVILASGTYTGGWPTNIQIPTWIPSFGYSIVYWIIAFVILIYTTFKGYKYAASSEQVFMINLLFGCQMVLFLIWAFVLFLAKQPQNAYLFGFLLLLFALAQFLTLISINKFVSYIFLIYLIAIAFAVWANYKVVEYNSA